MKRKHSKHSKLIAFTLTLLLAASITAPASAAYYPQWYWNQGSYSGFQPTMNIIRASNPTGSTPSNSSKPSASTTPSTSTTPATPASPSAPTQPTTPTASGSVSSLEQQVVTLVNQQRASYGLPALSLSTTLSNGARLKSQDMQKNHYFSHTSPTYGSPFDMMRSLGISYRSAGENIAMGYSTAAAVVNAWMNSPGHRANILSGSYKQIGVGYVSNGGYWTQWFTN